MELSSRLPALAWARLVPEPRRVVLDGRLHPEFEPVAVALRAQLGGPGGAAVCVYHRGEAVVDLWGGACDEAGTPWRQDTMAPSFSTTKGVAATLLHILVDHGLLDYDDRVADHWPEFAQGGKDRITVRHVLAHQSGLYHIRQMIDRAERMLDWDYMIHAIERTPPLHPPGERTGYHGLTFGYLVGEIAQRVTGRPFAQLVQDEIARPLGLDGMYIGAPEEVLSRAARLMHARRGVLAPSLPLVPADLTRWLRRGGAFAVERVLALAGVRLDVASILDALAPRGIRSFDFGAPETLRVSIPAANGLFTARSLARMYAALAGGGEIDGVRLLSARTLARATEVQTPAPGLTVMPFDMRWRLGYHGVLTTRGVPRHAFGHFGFGGSGAWADPRRQLAVALIVNSGLGTPFGDLRIARIGGAALASVDRVAAR
jgi:CubicO group peptidase (beta-lactamase class C family)